MSVPMTRTTSKKITAAQAEQLFAPDPRMVWTTSDVRVMQDVRRTQPPHAVTALSRLGAAKSDLPVTAADLSKYLGWAALVVGGGVLLLGGGMIYFTFFKKKGA
jgi:hypothetical protein